MITLILDQSTKRTGFCVIDQSGFQPSRLVCRGVIVTPANANLLGRTMSMKDGVERLIRDYLCNEVVIEDHRYSGGRNPETDEALAAVGFLCRAVAEDYGLPCYRQGVTEIKFNATGNGKADKLQMIEVAKSHFNLYDDITDDEADALCAAISWTHVGAIKRSDAKLKEEKKTRRKKKNG